MESPRFVQYGKRNSSIAELDVYSQMYKRSKSSDVGIMGTTIDYSDPFAIPNLMEELDRGIYGSVTKDIEDLCARRLKMLNPLLSMYSSFSAFDKFSPLADTSKDLVKTTPAPGEGPKQLVVIIDSDEEDCRDVVPLASKFGPVVLEVSHGQHVDARDAVTASTAAFESNQRAIFQYQSVVLKKPPGESSFKAITSGRDDWEGRTVSEDQKSFDHETKTKRDKGVYVGVQDDRTSQKSSANSDDDDGLGDIWREMTLALEFSKDGHGEGSSVVEQNREEEKDEECEHSFVLKDDLGYVCRVCGVIQRSIETIFDYQWVKGAKTSRNYLSEHRGNKDREQCEGNLFSAMSISDHIVSEEEIFVHPRHMKEMKPHQIEGFNFLRRNLVSEEPGGCIMAHAPGSGKTFMIISFIQSFLAKYPNGRPLVVLPKGIVGTWKKEFQRWQVEETPLYDFYSLKADNRSQQLEVLKQWIDRRGILFLGYKQFSNIICDESSDNIAVACQDILLKVPTILILDEGHTPRNENTNVLHSLAKVQTPRKVVLSGTLFQNHVKEVFNILNLVRPKFLKMDTSRAIKRRIMSRVQITNSRKHIKNNADASFFDLVEETLQNDDDFKRKVTVIQDLREMTEKVLHYYKGDFLDELPGLVDITVLLNLTNKQKELLEKLKKLDKFKRSAMGSAIYIHPLLKEISESSAMEEKNSTLNENKLDSLLNRVDVKDGVKAKFFLNLLALCESAGEKLLVFSHYLLPMKFLERLIVKTKGWSPGREIFYISGDSSSDHREWSMERFNNSPDAKVLFGSIKACGEGISLVGASRLLILDVHLNPSVTRQAIGRAFRPGQTRKVHVYRLVASDSAEEQHHYVCFGKELTSKMWFEWSEYSGKRDFRMETVNVEDREDAFWQSASLRNDVKVLYQR
ncbi:hypothetical protein Syun_015623 [Stephania yunnanensis]|uniref:Uncharacterized protein n=1 Tax=Stephania yunnanensis TaxID=152371 RepID=A0AAP0JN79_9MAGN